MSKDLKNEEKPKKIFHFDKGTPMDQIFALLDTVQSDNKNDIDKLMNDSDT